MIQEKLNELIGISVGEKTLIGELRIPSNPKAIVLFSHGSGSSRHSPRNKEVANFMRQNGFATLLIDLLSVSEDVVYSNRFDIDLLTDRLIHVTKWIEDFHETRDLSIGYFGASTGAASALSAAAILGDKIRAVVSRGGRPDLALRVLPEVQAAVQFIVGSLDKPVIGMNEVSFNALDKVKNKELILVSGASHLFEEPGKLKEVSELATSWFSKFL
jgi:putative phosphoribosyl transferase